MTQTLYMGFDDILVKNLYKWTTNSGVCLYLGNVKGTTHFAVEYAAVITGRPEPVAVFVDYVMGKAGPGQSMLWQFPDENRQRLYAVITKAREAGHSALQVSIQTDNSAIFSVHTDSGVDDVLETMALNQVPDLKFPEFALAYTDDRSDRVAFDGKRWAQIVLKADGRRVLVDLADEPKNRSLFTAVVLRTFGTQSFQDLKESDQDVFVAKAQSKEGNTTMPDAITAPATAPDAAPAAPKPVGEAGTVKLNPIKSKRPTPPVPPTPPVQEQEAEPPTLIEDPPEATTNDDTLLDEPVLEEPAVAAAPKTAVAAVAVVPDDDAEHDSNADTEVDSENDSDTSTEGKARRSRRSSEALDQEACNRLRAKKWLCVPPVQDLAERLQKDPKATVAAMIKDMDEAYDGLRVVRDMLFGELLTMSDKPSEDSIWKSKFLQMKSVLDDLVQK